MNGAFIVGEATRFGAGVGTPLDQLFFHDTTFPSMVAVIISADEAREAVAAAAAPDQMLTH